MNSHVTPAIVIPFKVGTQWHFARHPPRRRGTQWHASAFNLNSILYFSIAQHGKRSRALDCRLRGNDGNNASWSNFNDENDVSWADLFQSFTSNLWVMISCRRRTRTCMSAPMPSDHKKADLYKAGISLKHRYCRLHAAIELTNRTGKRAMNFFHFKYRLLPCIVTRSF